MQWKIYKSTSVGYRAVNILLLTVLLLSFIFINDAFSQKYFKKRKIIFMDNFEVGYLQDRWYFSKKPNWPDIIKMNYDPRHSHSGHGSMEITAFPGKKAGNMAIIWFNPGYNKVHVRWYCKFSSNFLGFV